MVGPATLPGLLGHVSTPTSIVPFSRTSRHQWVGSARKGAGSRSAGGWLLLRASSLLGLKREPESPYSISSSSSTVGLETTDMLQPAMGTQVSCTLAPCAPGLRA